jgi:hypothetical protein
MRAIAFVLMFLLAFPSNREMLAQKPRQTQPSAPVPWRFPAGQEPAHSHPPERDDGTAPCGYRNRPCPPQPQPAHEKNHTGRDVAIGVGAGIFAGALIASLDRSKGPERKLSDEGPQFPETFHMSAFKITGFVEGGWPLVIDYETEPGTYAIIDIATQRGNYYSVRLPTEKAGRQLEMLRLPLIFGGEHQIADFTIRATVSEKNDRLRYLRIYGIGCGRRAVGSVAIDQLRFGPRIISGSSDAQFSFHTHTDFDRMKAEFIQVALVDNCLEGKIFDDRKINKRLREDEHWNDSWNAGKAQRGQIQFRVRGWMTADRGADWVSAFSPEIVLKQ